MMTSFGARYATQQRLRRQEFIAPVVCHRLLASAVGYTAYVAIKLTELLVISRTLEQRTGVLQALVWEYCSCPERDESGFNSFLLLQR